MTCFHRARWNDRFRQARLGISVFFLFGCFGLPNASADFFSETLGASGSLRGAYWSRDKSFSGNRNFGVGSAWLNLKPVEFAEFRTFFEGYAQFQDLSRTTRGAAEVREAYIERTVGAFDFRIGRQINIWGRADKVNPTDQLTTKNLTRLFTDDEDQRLGLFAVKSVWNLESFRISGIWQPEWRHPVYPIPILGGITLIDQDPSRQSQQFGIQMDQSSSEWDGSISYFQGINRTPNLNLISAAGPTIIGLDYRNLQTFGGDFATTVGSYGLRSEVAYNRMDRQDPNPFRQKDFLFAVLGIEKTLFTDFNLNTQALYRHVFDFENSDRFGIGPQRFIAEQSALISNQWFQNQWGFTIRPSYKLWNETLELEVAYVAWLRNFNSLIRPKVTYLASDALKVIAGAEVYGGSPQGFFGRLTELNTFFLEFRFGF